jgi:hypothetical protein
LLTRFAGQGGLDGLYCTNDAVANGAIQAAESAGVKVGTAKGRYMACTVIDGPCGAHWDGLPRP